MSSQLGSTFRNVSRASGRNSLPARRLLDVELDSVRIDFGLDGVEGEVVQCRSSVASRARTHHTRPRYRNGIRLENVAPDQEVTGARMKRLRATVDASSTSQGPHDRRSCGGGIRNANPAMSGRPPGTPIPLDTRPMTSQDLIGSPSLSSAVRSKTPSASTPTGWKRRRPRTAAPSLTGNAVTSDTCTACGVPKSAFRKTVAAV